MIFNPTMPNVSELISPREIKFFPNPSAYDYIVDRNSDSASDGSGTSGSLRYCMTNCASGAIIVFADVLTDSAGTGDISTVKVLSVLPSKSCTIYGNDHWITASSLASYRLFYNAAFIIYSLHFRDMFRILSIFYYCTSLTVNGCRFIRLGNSAANGVVFQTPFVTVNNCDFQTISGSYYVILYTTSNPGAVFNKCNFRNIVTAGGAIGGIGVSLIDCYMDFPGTAVHNNIGFTMDRSFKTCGDLAYYGTLKVTNSIILNGKLWLYTGGSGDKTVEIYNNTIIHYAAVTWLGSSGVNTGYNLTIKMKNNLIITPGNTYVLEQTTPAGNRVITESGNIYITGSSDPLLPISTRFTGNPEAILDFNERKNSIEYVRHNYFDPKGSALLACARLSDVLTDYNGTSRPDPCDCGAIQT